MNEDRPTSPGDEPTNDQPGPTEHPTEPIADDVGRPHSGPGDARQDDTPAWGAPPPTPAPDGPTPAPDGPATASEEPPGSKEPPGSDEPPTAQVPPASEYRGGPNDPPPITAFAWRHGLVRPASGEGRLFAGVCGGFARATNTDPVLWRVILVVLSIFGGVGVIIYLLGWLLTPAEGDSATPVEAALGRGRSSTSSVRTIIAAAIVVISLGVGFSERFSPGLPGVILVAVAAFLLLRDRQRPRPAEATAGRNSTTAPLSTSVDPAAGGTTMSTPTAFAPYGPFSPTPPPPPPAPPTPRPRRPRSPLGRLTFSVAVLVVGIIGLADLAGLSVPTAAYLAAALTVVGLGLVVGAFYGRGRGLIGLGVILTLLLGAFGTLSFGSGFHGGDITWRPNSVSQVERSYDNQFGSGTLDLTNVDFSQATEPISINVGVNFGDLRVILPPDVDANVTAKVKFGDAQVFGQNWSGVNSGQQTATDLGADGTGGGRVNIDANVDFGSLEVHR